LESGIHTIPRLDGLAVSIHRGMSLHRKEVSNMETMYDAYPIGVAEMNEKCEPEVHHSKSRKQMRKEEAIRNRINKKYFNTGDLRQYPFAAL
jgi:hypothetical protein